MAGRQARCHERSGRGPDEVFAVAQVEARSVLEPGQNTGQPRLAERPARAEHEDVGTQGHGRRVRQAAHIRAYVIAYSRWSGPSYRAPRVRLRSAPVCARCARRWTCRCAISPSAAASARRCSRRSSGARRLRRCRLRRGSQPAWSYGCRSCCASTRTAPSTIVRRDQRRAGPGCQGHNYEVLTPPLPGQRAELSRHLLAPGAVTGGPVIRRCTSPAAARRRSSRPGSGARVRRARFELAAGDCVTFDADLPHHFENPGTEDAVAARSRERRPEKELRRRHAESLFDKIWERHEVAPGLLYVDLHLVHEVTSPQAFDGLRLNGRKVRRPTVRSPPPTTTFPPTGPQWRRGSRTSSRGCRWRRSSVTAPSSGSRCTRSAPSTRGSCT